jgi:Ca-activated chloride channel family protein
MIVLLLTCFSGRAQSALQGKKHLEEGNKAYKNGEFEQAKDLWQKAGENLYRPAPLNYNKGNAQYRTENFEEAMNSYKIAIEQSSDKLEKAKQYHNLGNTYLKSEKTKEAVEAYKQALRNNPYDDETRYNLAYAQNKLKKEEEQKDNQKDNQNEDKNNEQEKEKDKDKDKKDSENNDDKKNEKENKDDKQDGKQDDKNENKNQPKPSGISREQALKDLEAVKNDEKKVMEKLMKLNKEDKNKKTIEKDW